MKRVLVIGRSGAGKTTFSDKLGAILDCKVVHLDDLFWKPGWVRAFNTSEWEYEIRKLVQSDQWILDGNYHNTLDIRLERADTVFFFDTNPLKSIFRALKRKYIISKNQNDRMIKLHKDVKVTMLIRSAFRFPAKEIHRKIKDAGIKYVYIIKSPKEADELLEIITADLVAKEKEPVNHS
jgi:adenylate kinase family enzyme